MFFAVSLPDTDFSAAKVKIFVLRIADRPAAGVVVKVCQFDVAGNVFPNDCRFFGNRLRSGGRFFFPRFGFLFGFGFDGCRVRQYRVSRRSAFEASPPCLGLYLYRPDKQSQECRECLPLVAEDVAFTQGIERYDTFAPFDCRRVSFAYRFGRTGIAESLVYAAFAGKSLSTRFFSSATLLYAKL